MRRNRRGEPIGRESSVYLYGASRREVCRNVDPVGISSAPVSDQVSTHLDCWPEPTLVPKVCDVCRSQPAEAVVVEFIFACDRCAEKIRAATRSSRLGTETNRRFPDCGGLSSNSREPR